jgi:hypothetical protein
MGLVPALFSFFMNYLPFPMIMFGSQVEMPGTRQINNTPKNINSRNGTTPQITSLSGISGAMFSAP